MLMLARLSVKFRKEVDGFSWVHDRNCSGNRVLGVENGGALRRSQV